MRAQRSEVGTGLNFRALRCSFSSNSLCNSGAHNFTNAANPLKDSTNGPSIRPTPLALLGSWWYSGIRQIPFCHDQYHKKFWSKLRKYFAKTDKIANSTSEPPQCVVVGHLACLEHKTGPGGIFACPFALGAVVLFVVLLLAIKATSSLSQSSESSQF
jgi:hypothetical protein